MKLSTIYRKAARELHEGSAGVHSCMCDHVWSAADSYKAADTAIGRLSSKFEADALKAGAHIRFWGANWGAQHPRQNLKDYDLEEAKRCRVLALLFMAAMAEELEEKK